MSIVQNALVTGLPVAEPNAYPFQTNAQAFAQMPAAADGIAAGSAYGFQNGSEPFGSSDLYGGSSSGSTGLGSFGSVMNGIMNMLSSALSSLGGLFGGGSGSASGSSPWQSSTVAPQVSQQYYTNATASSVGDPHDAFNGTTARGATVGDTWNDMNGRPNLLDSDSFNGGYRVSTTDTAPQANGVTYNASATVSTDFGATQVTMNANGSYDVTEHGQNVTLTQGQAVPLSGTESVTLGSDGSLQISDQNARGGSISTTLASNGDGGVDVRSTASDVNLGGYLVGKTDAGVNDGGGVQPPRHPPVSPPSDPWPVRFPYGSMTTQGSGTSNGLSDLTQLLASETM